MGEKHARVTLDRYQLQHAIEKVDGYFSPCPSRPGGPAAEFERARAECAANFRARATEIESLTWEQFKARAAIAQSTGSTK